MFTKANFYHACKDVLKVWNLKRNTLLHFHVVFIFRPRETNAFQIMVNVAAMEKVTFELTYQELLKRTKGRYSHVIYVNPGQVVDDMSVEVAIKESRDLTSLRVPPIKNDTLTNYNVDSKWHHLFLYCVSII